MPGGSTPCLCSSTDALGDCFSIAIMRFSKGAPSARSAILPAACSLRAAASTRPPTAARAGSSSAGESSPREMVKPSVKNCVTCSGDSGPGVYGRTHAATFGASEPFGGTAAATAASASPGILLARTHRGRTRVEAVS